MTRTGKRQIRNTLIIGRIRKSLYVETSKKLMLQVYFALKPENKGFGLFRKEKTRINNR